MIVDLSASSKNSGEAKHAILSVWLRSAQHCENTRKPTPALKPSLLVVHDLLISLISLSSITTLAQLSSYTRYSRYFRPHSFGHCTTVEGREKVKVKVRFGAYVVALLGRQGLFLTSWRNDLTPPAWYTCIDTNLIRSIVNTISSEESKRVPLEFKRLRRL